SARRAASPVLTVRPSYVLLGDGEDLGDGGLAQRDLARAVVEENEHALLHRLLLDGRAVDVLEHQLADVVVDEQQLVDAGAAAVAGLVALVAADRLEDEISAKRLEPLARDGALHDIGYG